MAKKRKSSRTKKSLKKPVKSSKFKKEFVAFGNKRKVFWSITFAIIFLTFMGLPIIVENMRMLEYFALIWVLELIYIILYLKNKTK